MIFVLTEAVLFSPFQRVLLYVVLPLPLLGFRHAVMEPYRKPVVSGPLGG